MHALTRLTLLAVAGGLTLLTPALAAPPMSAAQLQIYCADPAHAQDPQCLQGNTNRNGHNSTYTRSGTTTGGNSGTSGTGGNSALNNPLSPPTGFSFSQHDRDMFHQRFGGFNFGVFPTPGFSITLGVRVPHSYGLRHVPRSIYRYYPQFRGYLFFVARGGTIVIVSPRSYRIVAVL